MSRYTKGKQIKWPKVISFCKTYLIAALVTRYASVTISTVDDQWNENPCISSRSIHQTYFMVHILFRTWYIYLTNYTIYYQWCLILPVWHKKPYETIVCVAPGDKKADGGWCYSGGLTHVNAEFVNWNIKSLHFLLKFPSLWWHRESKSILVWDMGPCVLRR